jgi:Uma2 family endonuclease
MQRGKFLTERSFLFFPLGMSTQTASTVPPGEIVGTADQRIIMHGVRWDQFEAILALRGDAAGPRITYLRGELELMSPSRNHESIKKLLARMVELYALEKDIELSAYGSWTLRNAPKERALEPDECYIIGDARIKNAPDLAVEVIWTSGGLDKLEVYRALGVEEVWLWRDGTIRMYRLSGDHYTDLAHSLAFPDLDVSRLARLADYEDQTQALMKFRDGLRR